MCHIMVNLKYKGYISIYGTSFLSVFSMQNIKKILLTFSDTSIINILWNFSNKLQSISFQSKDARLRAICFKSHDHSISLENSAFNLQIFTNSHKLTWFFESFFVQ